MSDASIPSLGTDPSSGTNGNHTSAAASATASTPTRIPLEDFFRNPEITNCDISPDGRHLAFMRSHQNRMNVFVRPIDSDEAVRVTSETDRDPMGYFWKGNTTIIYIRDFNGDENYHFFSVDINDLSMRDLTPFEGVRALPVDDLDEESETDILISLNKRNPEISDVYRLNVLTGEMTMVAENPGNVQRWGTDHDGKIRIAIASDGVNQTLLHRDSEESEFHPVLTTSFRETVDFLFFTFDNKNIYASSNLGRDKQAIVLFDPNSGKEIETIYEHPEVDVERLSYSNKRKVLTGILYNTWKINRHFLDQQTEQMYERLRRDLGAYEFGLANHDKEEEVFVIRTMSDRSLGAYYLYDTRSDELTKIGDVSPWLNEDDLAEMKPITYTSRDGLQIHGYLTLPNGGEQTNIPVVVNPHGGPWHRDSWGFNPEVQLLANRGYAVLQMNFRSSTGYGRAFLEAGFKQWGGTMQDDITDGVNWLIEQGIADPKRIAIYGASYGGYATLAGVTFTPDLYACGIDYVGVSNIFTFLKTIPPYWMPMIEMMYEMVGDPEADRELLERVSPVFHVDKIKVPLLVLQGAKDPRVNINESNQVVDALRARGVDVEYMVKENEGHGFHNEENRFEVYNAMEGFLAKHLA